MCCGKFVGRAFKFVPQLFQIGVISLSDEHLNLFLNYFKFHFIFDPVKTLSVGTTLSQNFQLIEETLISGVTNVCPTVPSDRLISWHNLLIFEETSKYIVTKEADWHS